MLANHHKSRRGRVARPKPAHEQTEKLLEELAHVARVATMGELTASIAHEINQPLGAIMSNAQACLRLLDGPKPRLEEVRDALKDIVNDGNRATEIMRRVRTFLRRSEGQRADLDVNDVIRDVARLLEGKLAKNRIALNLDLHQHPLLVTGDRIQLEQVVLNLMMNAIEAISQCSEIPRLIAVSSVQQSTTVVVSIHDSGPGFSRDDEKRLFQAFFTTKPQGLGMGLPISRSIVEAHGGCITAEHNEDRGVTFRIALPTAKESPDATANRLRHRR